MRTQVLVTVDTELSFGSARRGMDAHANFAASILGRTRLGDFGIVRQMELLEAYGLKAVFFVDPMAALHYGPGVIARIVEPIVARGHEVQLHLHPEWCALSGDAKLRDSWREDLSDYPLESQRELIALARRLLVEAGAPRPIAFRAGNFGADDNTLRALAELGIAYDSSFNPTYLGGVCRIALPPDRTALTERLGVAELPVSAIFDRPGRIRHAQLCALSATEMQAAIDHAANAGAAHFVIVSHSFELLSRDRKRPNRSVLQRFEALCRAIAEDPRLESATFATLRADPAPNVPRLPPSRFRTARRMAEQAFAALRYEAGL